MNRILTTIFFILSIFSYNAKSVIYNFSLEKGVKIPYEEIIVYADGISFGSLNSEGIIVLEKFYDDIYLKNENIDSIPCFYSKDNNTYYYNLSLSRKGNDLLMDKLLNGKYIHSSDMKKFQKDFDEFSQLVKDGKASNAEYKGGSIQMKGFLAENIRYPEEAVDVGYEGKVKILISIVENGKVDDVFTVYTPYICLAKEAMRVGFLFENFTPAQINGVNVKQQIVLPVSFILD